jgi:hypothetical protein
MKIKRIKPSWEKQEKEKEWVAKQKDLIDQQLLNRSVYITQLYQCVICKRVKHLKLMKFYYDWPKRETMVYANGEYKAIPCICVRCSEINNRETWAKEMLTKPRPKLDLIWKDNPVPINPWEPETIDGDKDVIKEREYYRERRKKREKWSKIVRANPGMGRKIGEYYKQRQIARNRARQKQEQETSE